jgi:hypothetical protein
VSKNLGLSCHKNRNHLETTQSYLFVYSIIYLLTMASPPIKTHEGQVPKTLEEVWDRSPKKLIVYGMLDWYS